MHPLLSYGLLSNGDMIWTKHTDKRIVTLQIFNQAFILEYIFHERLQFFQETHVFENLQFRAAPLSVQYLAGIIKQLW